MFGFINIIYIYSYMTSPVPVSFSEMPVLTRGIKELRVPVNCPDGCVLHLVLIRQRQESDDAWSNSRADWPELESRGYILQSPKRAEIPRLSQTTRVGTLTLHENLGKHSAMLLL